MLLTFDSNKLDENESIVVHFNLTILPWIMKNQALIVAIHIQLTIKRYKSCYREQRCQKSSNDLKRTRKLIDNNHLLHEDFRTGHGHHPFSSIFFSDGILLL